MDKCLLSIKPTINLSAGAFCEAYVNGQLEAAKWMLTINPTIDVASSYHLFPLICEGGHLEVAKWLFLMNPNIDVFSGFNGACSSGELEVAQWIWSVKSTSCNTFDLSYALFRARRHRNVDIVQWLLSLNHCM